MLQPALTQPLHQRCACACSTKSLRVHEQGADYEPARRSRAHQPARFPKVAVSTRAPRVEAARGPLDRLARAHQEGRPRSRRETRALLPPGLCLLAPMRGCEMTVWSLLTRHSLQYASQRGPIFPCGACAMLGPRTRSGPAKHYSTHFHVADFITELRVN